MVSVVSIVAKKKCRTSSYIALRKFELQGTRKMTQFLKYLFPGVKKGRKALSLSLEMRELLKLIGLDQSPTLDYAVVEAVILYYEASNR